LWEASFYPAYQMVASLVFAGAGGACSLLSCQVVAGEIEWSIMHFGQEKLVNIGKFVSRTLKDWFCVKHTVKAEFVSNTS